MGDIFLCPSKRSVCAQAYNYDDIYSAEEAYEVVNNIRKLVRWLQVCDGNMEEGSLRCDANISIRLKGEKNLGKKVEVKNK